MRKMLLALIMVSLGGFLLIFGFLKATDNKGSIPFPAEQGVLDLTDWNPLSNQVVPLDGQWEFYWDQLLEPGMISAASSDWMQVPGYWNEGPGMKKERTKGAATYRLKIKLAPSTMAYGLRISNVRMASTVYVNGQKAGGSGVPSLLQNEYRYENKPYNAFFTVQGDTAEIIIHIANFENSQGGIPYRIYFGSVQAIQTANTNTMLLNLTLIVSLLMLGCYQLSAFIIRKEDKGLLYFGLSCIIIAWSFASNGDRLLLEYFQMQSELYYKIQALTLFSSLITMVLFIQTMCGEMIPRWFSRSIVYIMGVYVSFVLVTPFRIYSNFNLMVSLIDLVAYLVLIIQLMLSYRKGYYGQFNKKSLALFILALCCFFVGLIDYALYLSSITLDYLLGYYAILSFCFLSSFIMSYRFSEAYNTIEGMAVKLQQADKQKDEFLLQTSHEFQTPLHGIINLSQSMLETGTGSLNTDHMQSLSMIRDTSRRLSGLVHDILDMEKIKRNELSVHPAPVDLQVTVSLVFELFRHAISGKRIRLVNAVPDHLPFVYADENRLKQIIHNLVGNAAKFTQAGAITISAQVMDKQVKIMVEDTGAGIPPSKWDTVFQPFEQAHSPREYGGTGLGLSISRRLLHLMNGAIYVDWSELDRGTRVAFTLPVADEGTSSSTHLEATGNDPVARAFSEEADEIVDLPQKNLGKYTLLAVDDEPSNLQVLSRLFAHDSYNLLRASNGAEALAMLESRSDIDLVLLDVMMPRMSGYEVCKEIRKRYSLFELPVVLLTVLHAPSDIAAGFEAGANDFIVKPFDAMEVRARTDTLLQLKQSVEAALRAEMDFLQSQIKPHFLFNSLNSIIALCRTDGIRAEKLITHLSYYLRRSFDPKPESFVLLQDELQLVEAYVEIEKARFEDRLTVLYDIHPDAMMKRILPLTIQPLVENAIRHGVMKKEEGGTVRLTIRLDGDRVYVEVWDNGVGMSPNKIGQLWSGERSSSARRGVGLPNIHRRLAHFCGEELRVTSAAGKWTRVCFQFRT